MSFASHYIVPASGSAISLAELKATACSVTLSCHGDDSMTLTLPRRLDQEPLVPYWSYVDLLDAGGTRRFRGWLMDHSPGGTGDREEHVYRFVGPWGAHLGRLTYCQLSRFAIDPTVEAELMTYQVAETSEIILSRDLTSGLPVSFAGQIKAALDWAIAHGAPIAYDLSLLPDLQVPEDQQQDRSVAEAVRGMLRWAPEMTCRWDYSGGTPVLRFGDASEGSFRRVAGADTIVYEVVNIGENFPVSWAAGARLRDFSYKARPDLTYPEYRIRYVREHDVAISGITYKWQTIEEDVSAVANGSFGRLISTVRLRGAVWTGTDYTTPEARPANGLARQIHRPFARVQYEMAWSTVAQEVDWVHAPGALWNATGCVTALATCNSVLQSVTRDIGRGTVSYQTGLWSHIGVDSVLAILRMNRLRNRPQHAGEGQYGFGTPEGATPGGDEGATIETVMSVRDGVNTVAHVVRLKGAEDLGVFEVS